MLWSGKVDEVINSFKNFKDQAFKRFCNYLESHRCRIINYQYYKKESISSIGSGTVESTIKRIGLRVKISGAQWNIENVSSMLLFAVLISTVNFQFDVFAKVRCTQTGGYNLEGTGLTGDRLIKIILLMTISYSRDIIEGTIVKRKHLQKYVSRTKEPQRTYRRRSTFGSGNDSQKWINYL